MTDAAHEVNFDGLVGPTHNYAGLSRGNLASQSNRLSVSRPREAAMEGLLKMKMLSDLGVKQAVLPPHERPDLRAMRRLGFTGTDAQVLDKARREDPTLLAACCSASAMWAANAATVSPGPDTADGRVHFTPANLISQFHRSLEPPTTAAILRAIFREESAFAHHPPLPAAAAFGDEGAANHFRLCPRHGGRGVECFVYGRAALRPGHPAPARYPARQIAEASAGVARLHQIDPSHTLLLQQNPAAIDAGAFHNDVVAVGNENVLLCHARALSDGPAAIEAIRRAYARVSPDPLHLIEVTEDEMPLAEAVRSYLFNSQIVSLPDGTMVLIAPMECRESPAAESVLRRLLAADTPVRSIRYADVRQSMNNGGGPACLRLRVVLTASQLAFASPHVFLTDCIHQQLTAWVQQHYRETLHPDDLADPKLLDEGRTALDQLTRLLQLGSVYQFQQT